MHACVHGFAPEPGRGGQGVLPPSHREGTFSPAIRFRLTTVFTTVAARAMRRVRSGRPCVRLLARGSGALMSGQVRLRLRGAE